MSRNQIVGTIAITPEKRKKISHLDVSSNLLEFQLTKDFLESLIGAKEISASDNYIYGELPTTIDGSYSFLQRFDIGGNCLYGTIPVTYDVVRMPQIEVLKLNNMNSDKCAYRFDKLNMRCFESSICEISKSNVFARKTVCCRNREQCSNIYEERKGDNTICLNTPGL